MGTTIFESFTNKYSLSKTLRFELVPVGKDGKRRNSEDAAILLAQIIKKDTEIKNAYVALKPVMDKIHEEVINESLTSDEARKINFPEYLEKYSQKTDMKSEEDSLRGKIVKTYNIGAQSVKLKSGNEQKRKSV